jgi:LysM repeat protein
MGGVVTQMVTSVTKNGASQTGNTTTYSYQWWQGALQSRTNYVSGSTNNNSTFYYDESGNLTSVYIQDGRPRTISFINDANGQVLQRDEADNKSSTGDPRELHFYFNGIRVGDISNNGSSEADYATSIASHLSVGGTGPFRNGSTISSNYADFDQSYDPINGLNYESTSTRYTVQAGDTLEAIAQTLWGDASFWYMIADANGLTGSESLVAGRSLIIPNKVHNSHNNADTYKVYDPNEAIGDTMPTAAKPPKKNKCGAFGQILSVVVSIAVYALVSMTPLAPLAPMAADAARQGTLIATGNQKGFSFKSLAIADLTASLTGPIGGLYSGVKSAALQAALTQATTNLAVQGISVATGLQSRFDWAGVAAAGATAGIGRAASRGLARAGYRTDRFTNTVLSGMAVAVANGGARSLITGTSFGDNIVATLPSVIGNTIGNLAADAVARADRHSGFPRGLIADS